MTNKGQIIGLVALTFFVFSTYAYGEKPPASEQALYPIVKKDKWGYIDKTGKIVIEPQFEAADHFQEGLAPVKMDDKVGYIDTTGKVVIQPLFDDAFEFKDGVAAVRVGKRWGYIDSTGKYIWLPSK